MKEFYQLCGTILVGLVVIAGMTAITTFPVKWCWNHAMTHAFDLPRISWGHAWCLTFLSAMFIKSHLTKSK